MFGQMNTKGRKETLVRQCFAIARDVFGSFRIGGVKAYDYYMKKFVEERLGKKSRAELDENDWQMVLEWLLEIKLRMERQKKR